MTYKQLIETIEIAAKYNGGLDAECRRMWAEHDEHGLDIDNTPSAEELRKLAKMGWLLGCDVYINEKDAEKWENPDSLTDEEIVSLFEEYHSIYKYE